MPENEQFDQAWDDFTSILEDAVDYLKSRRTDPNRHFNMISGMVAQAMRATSNWSAWADITNEEEADKALKFLHQAGEQARFLLRKRSETGD